MTEPFFGFDLVIDESIAPGDFKIMHADGSAQVFRINPDESVTEMVVNPIGKVFDPDSVAGRFWIASRLKRERREEIEAMPRLSERAHATMVDAWQQRSLTEALYNESPLLDWVRGRHVGDRLEEWLAEDSWMPEVAEALL